MKVLIKMHKIEINNIKSNENFHYPFIVIKGQVHSGEKTVCKQIQSKINVMNSHTIYTSPLYLNKFKQLIELNPGENYITISYCCVSLSITLSFLPQLTELSVVPLYIICDGHDGCFQAPATEDNDHSNALKRIDTGLKLIQAVMAEKLYEAGLQRKTFNLDNCVVFRSNLFYKQARKMKQKELWFHFAREIMSSVIGSSKKKYIGFVSCTKYSNGDNHNNYEEILNQTEAHASLGGGGLALFGTACLYTWPENVFQVIEKFTNEELVDRRQFMDDSCYRGTLGYCFATTLGSVLHELCHTFDLGHTEYGVMGRGFDNIHKVFLPSNESHQKKLGYFHRQLFDNDQTYWTESCSVLLSYHRWFNNYDSNIRHKLFFDFEKRLLKSTAGIRVVEIRDVAEQKVLQNWVFTGRILKFSFVIPWEVLNKLECKTVLIVAEDSIGNILKQNVDIQS